MKAAVRTITFLAVLSVILSGACNKGSTSHDIDYTQYTEEELDSMTITSLELVDDYPLYTMIYYGDYGFADFIETGYTSNDAKTQTYVDKWACTCFAAMGSYRTRFFGRNFDWSNRATLLLYTKPPDAYASVSMVDLFYLGYNAENLADSTTDLERLLDTPYLPFDGMNEKGVAVSMMAVPEVKAPEDPDKVTIGEIHVIRLILDYAKDVNEAIDLLQQYNVRIEEPPIHYLIADRSDNSVVIEFVDGEMIILRNEEPWQVSTNFVISDYEEPGEASCWRYDSTSAQLEEYKGDITADLAMDILESVSQPFTIWSTVYDMSNGDIRVAMGTKYNEIHKFNLNKF